MRPDAAIEHLEVAIDKTAEMGALALSGVIFGGIGERTGVPPTEKEYDNIARVLTVAAKHAKTRGIELGVEAVNRYENHLINTGAQAAWMVEKVGADNVFVHLDTYHMNIEEKGAANGILACRDHLKYIHLSESDRGTPGTGNCAWDEIYATLAAIRLQGRAGDGKLHQHAAGSVVRPVGLAAGRQGRGGSHGQRPAVPAQQGAAIRADPLNPNVWRALGEATSPRWNIRNRQRGLRCLGDSAPRQIAIWMVPRVECCGVIV